MSELWGPTIAGIGLLATVVFGLQGEARGRYERVLALLEQLGTGEEVESRHNLGRHVYKGFPDVPVEQRAQLVEDFFIVASGLRRLRATLTSVRASWLPGPARLLAESTERMVLFMDQNIDQLASRFEIVDIENIHDDLRAIHHMTGKYDLQGR